MAPKKRNRALLFLARVCVAVVCAAGVVYAVSAADRRMGATATVGEAASNPAAGPGANALGEGEGEEEVGLGWIGAGYKYLIDNYTEFQVTWIGSFVLHEVAYFGAYLPWIIVDAIPWCRRYKIQASKDNDWAQQWRCLRGLLAAHVFVQLPLMAFFHTVVIERGGMKMGLPLPQLTTLAWQIPVFFVIEDFYFYWVHRFLHWKKIYKYIHKIHHTHAAPFGMAAEYAHPVETLFLGLGTLLGPMFFADHLLTVWIYLVFRLYETVEDHSGYMLPWYFNPTSLIPFWGGADHHDFHHENFEGNYADVFTVWDYVFGTDKEWRALKRVGRLKASRLKDAERLKKKRSLREKKREAGAAGAESASKPGQRADAPSQGSARRRPRRGSTEGA